MNNKFLLPMVCLMWLSCGAPAQAGPLVFTHEIDSSPFALGGGEAAAAVRASGGDAVNFAAYGPAVLETSVSGWVHDNSDSYQVSLVMHRVSEPGTLGLLALALFGLAWRRRE